MFANMIESALKLILNEFVFIEIGKKLNILLKNKSV